MKGIICMEKIIILLALATFSQAREVVPPPFAGTPFPNQDLPLHGGPWIGTTSNKGAAPNATEASALEKAIDETGIGNALKSAGIHAAGWGILGANVSTAKTSNLPLGYSLFPNRIDLNEVAFRLVRNVDTLQEDHIDWGFRIDALYGADYYMFISKGLFFNQFVNQAKTTNVTYGFDIPQIYGDVYFPQIADGMNIRAGRVLTNPTVYMNRTFLFSHTVYDSSTGDTQTGVFDTLKLNNNITLQLGVANTPDVSLFAPSDRKTSLFAAAQLNTTSQADSLYLMVYGLNDGNYAYHNWQTFYAIWTHKFSQGFFFRLQNAYFYMNNVPVNAGENATVYPNNYIPAGTLDATVTKANTRGYSVVGLLAYAFSDLDYIAARFENTLDQQGTLTGTAALYRGYTLGWGHTWTSWLSSTAEVRRDIASATAYNGGTASTITLGIVSLTARY